MDGKKEGWKEGQKQGQKANESSEAKAYSEHIHPPGVDRETTHALATETTDKLPDRIRPYTRYRCMPCWLA